MLRGTVRLPSATGIIGDDMFAGLAVADSIRFGGSALQRLQ